MGRGRPSYTQLDQRCKTLEREADRLRLELYQREDDRSHLIYLVDMADTLLRAASMLIDFRPKPTHDED